MNPQEPHSSFREAMTHFLRADYAKSLLVFETLCASRPSVPDFAYGRALNLFLLGRDEEALHWACHLETELGDMRGGRLRETINLRRRPAQRAHALPSSRLRLWWVALTVLPVIFLLAGAVPAGLIYKDWQDRTGQVLDSAADTYPSPAAEAAAPAQPPPAQAVPDEAPDQVPAEPIRLASSTEELEPSLHEILGRRAEEEINSLPPLPEGPVATIIELQPYRKEEVLSGSAAADSVKLINLNPRVGAWYILETRFGGRTRTFHLEVPIQGGLFARRPGLSLYSDGLEVRTTLTVRHFPLWVFAPQVADAGVAPRVLPSPSVVPGKLASSPALNDVLLGAEKQQSAYSLLCDNLVLLRNQRPGSATEVELATDLFRRTRMGEWLVEKAKPYLIRRADTASFSTGQTGSGVAVQDAAFPQSAKVDAAKAQLSKPPETLGIAMLTSSGALQCGQWYPAALNESVYVSAMLPEAVDEALLSTYTDRVDPLDSTWKGAAEKNSLVYLLAFDLGANTLGFSVGTDHPSVEWSERASCARKAKGPDGFDTKAPFVSIGAVPPYLAPRTVATFAGGFKRKHGAFNCGDLSAVNNSNHFGFVEQGVVFSRLNPGVATVEIRQDGAVDLLTWPPEGAARFPFVLHARQNGPALIEGVDADGVSIPGPFVNRRYEGAWSSNVDGHMLTIRVGLGVQETQAGRRFLILAYFTGATPNAMARVFQAYGVRYAMGLDMNSPALCYAALYGRDDQGRIVKTEYLHTAMATANGTRNGLRFVGSNDLRDCFYVLRKS